MTYNTSLSRLIASNLEAVEGLEEKKIFGGVGFLINGNLAVGVHKNDLIVRVGREQYTDAIILPNTRPFDMTGRPMSGWVVVAAEGLTDPEILTSWILKGVNFARSLPPKG